jgi:hypothetical protein
MLNRRRLYALGRLKDGERNKTETRYERHLAEQLLASEVLWYRFEHINLRLAKGTFLNVDFAVLAKDSVLEMHDVKGSAFQAAEQSDGRAKMKVAASIYPFRFKLVWPRKGGGWEVEDL